MIQPRINQKQIAQQLKLSPATVSKSFRNHPDISAETRAKVLAHAASLGYHPEVVGWGARFGQGPTPGRFVGVLIHDNHGVGFADQSGQGYVTGMSEAASRFDATLIVHRFAGDSRLILDPAHQPPAMRQNALQGLILVHRYDPAVVAELANQLPCVSLTFYVPGARCDHIDSNYIGAIGQLVAHLHEQGHERIGYVGHPNHPSNSFARFGAFAQALARRGLPLEMPNVIDVYDDVRDWDKQAELVERRLKLGVTAWVCSVDTVGYQLFRRLRDAGYDVPGDLSITGYDNDEPMFGLPQLTTVRVPFVEMGAYALSQLLERIDRPSIPQSQTLLDCSLVHGRTTGTAPGSHRR